MIKLQSLEYLYSTQIDIFGCVVNDSMYSEFFFVVVERTENRQFKGPSEASLLSDGASKGFFLGLLLLACREDLHLGGENLESGSDGRSSHWPLYIRPRALQLDFVLHICLMHS